MTFLSADMQTAFSIVPCTPAGAITFDFSFGFVFSNYTEFHIDPGPPPYAIAWNYTASNSANSLRIDGVLGTLQSSCADVPTRFNHSNVVAVLTQEPKLSVVEVSKERGARIMLQGNAGSTNVIEASLDLAAWTPVSTNVMDFSLCPICPFVIFEDSASTNPTRRFYRAFQFR